jgi:hypothetical protein
MAHGGGMNRRPTDKTGTFVPGFSFSGLAKNLS